MGRGVRDGVHHQGFDEGDPPPGESVGADGERQHAQDRHRRLQGNAGDLVSALQHFDVGDLEDRGVDDRDGVDDGAVSLTPAPVAAMAASSRSRLARSDTASMSRTVRVVTLRTADSSWIRVR